MQAGRVFSHWCLLCSPHVTQQQLVCRCEALLLPVFRCLFLSVWLGFEACRHSRSCRLENSQLMVLGAIFGGGGAQWWRV